MIRTVSETGSTNADLLAALRSGQRVPEGAWLVADRQNAGRGRQGRSWFDGAGNFMGSTVIRLGDGDPPPATLALVAGVALFEAVQPQLGGQTTLCLKWPNDLMLDGAKLAGILLEREGDAIVAGFGVNLVAAPQLDDRATIALAQVGDPPARDAFAAAIAATVDRELERWRHFGLEPLIRRWESAAHPKGAPLLVSPPGEGPIAGTFDGLRPDGALALRLADGSVRVIHAGDVMLAQPES